MPIPNQNMKLKEIVKEDIIKIGNNLAKSALRSKKDGFDGIILHRTYFSLVILFLSHLNKLEKMLEKNK